MVFSSTIFLFLFLPVVLVVHFLLPRRARNPFLLLASLFFYAWGEHEIVFALIGSILVNYVLGRWIHSAASERSKRVAVTAAVVGNLLLLATFKYLNFIGDNVDRALGALGLGALELPYVALPIGISFFTFQALSYVIDLYRGRVAVQRDATAFALYISLFPQLIAGPIVRYSQIAEQLSRRTITRDAFVSGLARFIVGFGKKVLVANTVAEVTDEVFALDPGHLPASVAWVGILAFTLQVYFDFSGYSDMAIGLGRMLGFSFPENFHYPYVARSIRDVWRRWHISLTTWFRDYLYIPMGGSRRGPLRTYLNLMTVFVLCGLWHGASWTFVIFGFYQGVFLILERQPVFAPLARVWTPLKHVYAMWIWMFGLVFFRAESLPQVWSYWAALLGSGEPASLGGGLLVRNDHWLALAFGVVGCLPWIPALRRRIEARGGGDFGPGWSGVGTHALAVVALLAILGLSALELAGGTHDPFIYFRF